MSVIDAPPPADTVPLQTSASWSVWRRNIVEAVPRLATRRDARLPVIVAFSLALHGTVLVWLYLYQSHDEALQPQEIPIELVQLPPPPTPPVKKPQGAKEAAKPETKPETKPSTQDAAKQMAAKEAAKREAAKEAAKQAAKEQAAKETAAKQAAKAAAEQARKQAAAERAAKQEAAKEPPKPAQRGAEKPQPPQQSVEDRMKQLLGPMPGQQAAALPGTSDSGTEEVSYSQIVMSRIAKAKKEGRYPGIPGYATVEFKLGDGGEVTHLDLLRASGDPSLDDEAVALIKRAEPYPPPPPGGRRDYVVTLQFRAMPQEPPIP